MLNIFSLWGTFNSVIFYITLVISVLGMVGNGLVLWNLGFHIKKGPLNTYVLNLAAADFLFLSCQVGFSAAQAVLGSSNDTLYFVITFIWFSVGLWLLACLCLECCLSSIFPSCYQKYRPRLTSAVLSALVWGLTLPAVLLPANACGMLHNSTRLLACLRYHGVSITWLLAVVCVAIGTTLVLFIWVTCCSQRQHPKLYRIVRCSGILLFLCRLPMVIYWSLRPILKFLIPFLLPLATLLACIDSSTKPLLYFLVGIQPRKREPLRVVLQKALGEEAQVSLGGLSLPMSRV
ncbi:mas-related G-protein coupled receptor member G [Castor canadensis]|uniref:Mas-related G-protein coupled receptor member G n=1 Tax=Castor canadensis TaxID=51338 RepID=A0A8B7UXL0_CASCN